MDILENLKKDIASRLDELDLVVAWGKGHDGLHSSPMYVRREADLENMVVDHTCVNNLASSLMHLRHHKVGIVVKGCDSRSVVQLFQEKLINHESVVVFGVPCFGGIIDHKKVGEHMDISRARDVEFTDTELKATVGGESISIPLKDVLADKCASCRYPNPVYYDHLAGEPVELWMERQEDKRLEKFLERPMEERFEFWAEHMDRCIRCYACRNSCPMCFCRDFCLGDSRNPHWQSQEASVREKWLFQMVHAMHLAGRCTECGECERACPMGIPILLLKKQLNGAIRELFDYEAGVDHLQTPPLLTYKVDEDNINEGEL